MKLKLLDLFSGIGGFSLGFEKTGGFETIAFCEKDKFCQKVLAKHWNNIKIYDEIRNLKSIQADVITGGFPCQPFSVAGKRKGTDDDRYLWDETIRVIAETKPKWFVGENVEGIVRSCNKFKKIWKPKTSKSNVLLFQLAVLAHGTKEKEFGLLATPNTMDHLPPRSKEGTLKLMRGHRKGRTKPCNLREQMDPETMKMYPTPTQDSKNERMTKYNQGGTPLPMAVRQNQKPGGKLNPNFVEFLMAYPTNWTKIDQTELKR